MPVLVFFQTYEKVFTAVGAAAIAGALVFAGRQIRDAGNGVEVAIATSLR